MFFKPSLVLVGLSLIAILTTPVFAQDTSSSAARKLLIAPKVASNSTLTQKAAERKGKLENKLTALKETRASKEASFKSRVAAFKDKVRATLTERVNNNLNTINKNQTDQMKKNLTTLTSILDKLETRVNQAAADVKDPASAKAAIVSARSVIATASAKVEEQSQKDYTIQVTSEAKIKGDAKTQRGQLHKDLTSTRKAVVDAKQAVASAISTAKAMKAAATLIPKEGTASGKK